MRRTMCVYLSFEVGRLKAAVSLSAYSDHEELVLPFQDGTPLMFAINSGNLLAVDILIRAGANYREARSFSRNRTQRTEVGRFAWQKLPRPVRHSCGSAGGFRLR